MIRLLPRGPRWVWIAGLIAIAGFARAQAGTVASDLLGTRSLGAFRIVSAPAVQVSEDTVAGTPPSEDDTQTEPHIAVDPNHPTVVVAVFQEGRFPDVFPDGGCAAIGFATSHDAGQTWTKGELPNLTVSAGGPFARNTDPVAAFGPDGAVYAVSLPFDQVASAACRNTIAVQRSDDGGITWNAAVFAEDDLCSAVLLDKPWIVVDTFKASPHFGRIYCAWDSIIGANEFLHLRFSDDRGQNWSGRKTVASEAFLPVLLVQPNGDLTVVFLNPAVSARTSHDGGMSFDPVIKIADFMGSGPPDIRTGALPAAAVDPLTGNLYAVWYDTRFRSDGLNDIVISQSKDGGKSWGAVRRVNPDATSSGLDHFTPAVAALKGVVHVTYRTRDMSSGSSDFVEMRYIVSLDSGDHFTGERTLGEPADLRFAAITGGQKFLGDYMGIALSEDFAHAVWCRSFAEPASPAAQHQTAWSTRLCTSGLCPQMQLAGDLAAADTCVGTTSFATLEVCNTGDGDLHIGPIISTDSQFAVLAPSSGYPVTISPDFCFPFRVQFSPTSGGDQSTRFLIPSNDPLSPTNTVSGYGRGVVGDIRVTGSTDFGEVCFGPQAEKAISVCNVGRCDLVVSNVFLVPGCPDFILVNNPFPAVVSHDSCLAVVIRFTPSSCGSKTCTLRINSDDPDHPVIDLPVTASTPCSSIDVPPDVAFPPTVISSFGPCRSLEPFPISNTGTCPLKITNIQIGGPRAAEYSLIGLPLFPIILEPGHIVGEGDLSIAFAPTALDRNRQATITVTYESDPRTGATMSVTRALCGEGVSTGARVLVMVGGLPIANVEKIQLGRINANRNKQPLDTKDVVQNAALMTIVPTPPCQPFQYHREYGTVSNPIQLLAGSYQVTVSALVNGKRKSQTVGFDVSTCDFNSTIVIKF